MKKRPKSLTRLQAREVEKKVVPAIKLLSQHMASTTPEAPERDFHGYSCPAGDFVDNFGNKWQLQIHAYRAKKYWFKTNEIKPIIRKGAILFKLRLIISGVIEKIMK